MKNNVEEIMKEYRKTIQEIDAKYEVKEEKVEEINTEKLDSDIEFSKRYIEQLETQGKNHLAKEENKEEKQKVDEMIKKAKERLEEQLNEKQKIEETYIIRKELKEEKNQVAKVIELKNSKVILPSGREVTQTEKDNMDKNKAEDKARRELTQESQNISKQIMEKGKELDIQVKEEEYLKSKYELEKAKGAEEKYLEKTEKEINKNKRSIAKIGRELKELNQMQKDCQKYLEEFKQKDNEKAKKISEAWNETKRDEEQNKEMQEQKLLEKLENNIIKSTQKQENEFNGDQTKRQDDNSNEDPGKKEKSSIVFDIGNKKIQINGIDKKYNKKEIIQKINERYAINSMFVDDKKAKRNVDYLLVAALEKIDHDKNDKDGTLVKAYLNIIRDGKTTGDKAQENIQKINEAVEITYKADKELGILASLKEKRLARYAKKMGIASLDGISEKSLFETISEKAKQTIAKIKQKPLTFKKQEQPIALDSAKQEPTNEFKKQYDTTEEIKQNINNVSKGYAEKSIETTEVENETENEK